jgi:hypothetical protein
MLTILLGVLAAVPVLGEAGESCRSNADCLPSLACVASTCAERVVAPPPIPVRVSTPPAEVVEPPSEVSTDVALPEEPPAQFNGVHFFVGVMAGAGPAWVNANGWVNDRPVSFFAVVPQVPLELRVGLLLGRFELAAEVAPASTFFFNGSVREQLTAALSVGGLIKLYERETFSVSLPIRARGGLAYANMPGLMGGASLGLALRFGNALVEARLLSGELRVLNGSAIVALPFSLSFSWIF